MWHQFWCVQAKYSFQISRIHMIVVEVFFRLQLLGKRKKPCGHRVINAELT